VEVLERPHERPAAPRVPERGRAGEGYESPGYETAANRVDIDVQGGVGSIKVIGGA
jgi:hypothetical protein